MKNGNGFYQLHYQFYYYREVYPFVRQNEPIQTEVKSLELRW